MSEILCTTDSTSMLGKFNIGWDLCSVSYGINAPAGMQNIPRSHLVSPRPRTSISIPSGHSLHPVKNKGGSVLLKVYAKMLSLCTTNCLASGLCPDPLGS